MYPNLYLQVTYLVDPKTQLVNPQRKDEDIIIWVSPYGENGMSDAFNAPRRSVVKEVHGSEITFGFVYLIEFIHAKVGADVKYFKAELDIKPGHGLVEVKGTVNTKTRQGHTDMKKK